MNDTLAMKHKNSLSLKENRQLRETSKSKSCNQHKRPFQFVVFCVITCSIFLCYWIILCPLLINVFHLPKKSGNDDYWPIIWLFIYWFTALLVWLIIMLILISIWRSLSKKYGINTPIKTYGSDGVSVFGNLKNGKHSCPENIKLNDMQGKGTPSNRNSDINKLKTMHEEKYINITNGNHRDEIKKRKNLSPLMIHRQNSGDNIENLSTVDLQKDIGRNDENEDSLNTPNKGDSNANRDSIKDYLKLVTVTPIDDELDTIKSPKGPLSPRQLFFIDLIREAEKAERDKASDNRKETEGKHFFPSDFSPTDCVETRDLQNVGTIAIEKETSNNSNEDSTYFIANINSPKSEKTEVFLEIDGGPSSSKEWTVDVNEEKPVLNVDENNENENPTEKIIVFEV